MPSSTSSARASAAHLDRSCAPAVQPRSRSRCLQRTDDRGRDSRVVGLGRDLDLAHEAALARGGELGSAADQLLARCAQVRIQLGTARSTTSMSADSGASSVRRMSVSITQAVPDQ